MIISNVCFDVDLDYPHYYQATAGASDLLTRSAEHS